MTLELFNPFARYVVVKLQRRHFESEYGYTDCVDLVTPVCFCEELEEAEKIVFVMDDGRYEVRENAAWKTQETQTACGICGNVLRASNQSYCDECEARARIRITDSGILYDKAAENCQKALPRKELPDTPAATPTGHGVWTKS